MGAQIAPRCRLAAVEVPRNPWDVHLEEGVALDRGVVLLSTGERQEIPRISIGPRTYVNRFTMFDISLSIRIGADVMIGPMCYITDHDHGTAPGASVAMQPMVEAPVVIGRNAWLGADVKVLKGVTIGENAVIGAGSVVTRDVSAGARVAGVPARLLKSAAAA